MLYTGVLCRRYSGHHAGASAGNFRNRGHGSCRGSGRRVSGLGHVRGSGDYGDSHRAAGLSHRSTGLRPHGGYRGYAELHRAGCACPGRGRTGDAGEPDAGFRALLLCGGYLAPAIAAHHNPRSVGHCADAHSGIHIAVLPGPVRRSAPRARRRSRGPWWPW